MKVLVACEFSGIVRDAFIAEGHDAISCDLLPTESPGPHIQGDVRPLLREPWDLIIAHPPCNYLTAIQDLFPSPDPSLQKFEVAVEFFVSCLGANALKIAVENPRMRKLGVLRLGKPDMFTEPCHFGDGFIKRTGLWLRGLPPLMATLVVPNPIRYVNLEKRRRRPSGLGIGIAVTPHERSRFWPGMAAAMAKQWGSL